MGNFQKSLAVLELDGDHCEFLLLLLLGRLAFDIKLHSYLFACGQRIMACQYNSGTWKRLSEYRREVCSGWDCQNTAIVVGEFAAELRPYIYPRNII